MILRRRHRYKLNSRRNCVSKHKSIKPKVKFAPKSTTIATSRRHSPQCNTKALRSGAPVTRTRHWEHVVLNYLKRLKNLCRGCYRSSAGSSVSETSSGLIGSRHSHKHIKYRNRHIQKYDLKNPRHFHRVRSMKELQTCVKGKLGCSSVRRAYHIVRTAIDYGIACGIIRPVGTKRKVKRYLSRTRSPYCHKSQRCYSMRQLQTPPPKEKFRSGRSCSSSGLVRNVVKSDAPLSSKMARRKSEHSVHYDINRKPNLKERQQTPFATPERIVGTVAAKQRNDSVETYRRRLQRAEQRAAEQRAAEQERPKEYNRETKRTNRNIMSSRSSRTQMERSKPKSASSIGHVHEDHRGEGHSRDKDVYGRDDARSYQRERERRNSRSMFNSRDSYGNDSNSAKIKRKRLLSRGNSKIRQFDLRDQPDILQSFTRILTRHSHSRSKSVRSGTRSRQFLAD